MACLAMAVLAMAFLALAFLAMASLAMAFFGQAHGQCPQATPASNAHKQCPQVVAVGVVLSRSSKLLVLVLCWAASGAKVAQVYGKLLAIDQPNRGSGGPLRGHFCVGNLSAFVI